jgi:hypothetical protein
MDAHNDNEPLSFIALSAATRNAVRWLLKPDEQKHEQTPGNADAGDGDKKDTHADREYIEHRLRELRSWERKIGGGKDRPRRKF